MKIYYVALPILYASLIIAFCIGISKWKSLKKTPEKYLVFFLGFTIISELAANILKLGFKYNTTWITNASFIISNLILIYWYYLYLQNRTILYISIAGVCLAFMINSYYQNFLNEYMIYANAVITIFLILNLMYYLRTLLLNDRVIEFTRIPAFWISIGIIIYQINLILVFFIVEQEAKLNVNVFYLILTTVSVIFYSLISYAISIKT